MCVCVCKREIEFGESKKCERETCVYLYARVNAWERAESERERRVSVCECQFSSTSSFIESGKNASSE